MLQFKPFSQHQVQCYQVPYPTPQSEGFSLFCSVFVNIPKFHHYSYHQQIISSNLQMRTVTNIRKSNHSHTVMNTALSMEPGNFQASSRALFTLTSCLSPPLSALQCWLDVASCPSGHGPSGRKQTVGIRWPPPCAFLLCPLTKTVLLLHSPK